jgi:hypothetical protein
MRGRLPLFVLLASALTFLASLFLPWRETAGPSGDLGLNGGPSVFQGGSVTGWVAVPGDVAVLLVVGIVLATITALRRPQLGARLPLGALGVALGYFAVAVAIEVQALTQEVAFTGQPHRPQTSWAYGAYLGLASAAIATLSALILRRSELLRTRRKAETGGLVLGIALLISFFLPWVGFGGTAFSLHGIENPAAAIVALGLVLGAGGLQGEAGQRWRLPFAIGTAVLTGGAASATGIFGVHLYGAWIGIGCAVALVALEAVRAWPEQLPLLPHGPAAVRLGAAALLIGSLFLPWQEIRIAGGYRQGYDGWYSVTGAAAGGLCLLLLATLLLPALEGYLLEAVAAVVIFVSVAGTAFRESQSIYRIGYGSVVGFAAVGILLIATLLPLRRPVPVDRERALARAVPLAASGLCVAAAVVPLWFVLPETWTYRAYALHGSLAVAGVLLALYLIRLWARGLRGPATTDHQLTLVPLTLLTLAALELIRYRNGPVIWGAVILVGLCLLLALLGWIEERDGLKGFRVPQALRVDRLPETDS